LNPSPLDTDDPSQIERWGNKFGWGIDYANLEAHQQASRDERNEYRREGYAEMRGEYELLKEKKLAGGELTNEEAMKIKKFEDAKVKKNESQNQRRAKENTEYLSLKQKQVKESNELTNEEVMKIKKFEDALQYQREYHRAKVGDGGENDTAEQQANRKKRRVKDREYQREYHKKALAKARLTTYYRRHNPAKVDTIDQILELYDGRMEVLNENLKKKVSYLLPLRHFYLELHALTFHTCNCLSVM
jgi:hypothetical protein